MLKKRQIKERGKIQFSQYFQEFNKGEKVAILRNLAENPAFPVRIQGNTGVIIGKKGNACIISMMDRNEKKTYIIKPIHLKKITSK